MLVYGFAFGALCAAIPRNSKCLEHGSWSMLVEGYTTYEIKSRKIYWLTFAHQAVSFNSAIFMTASFDTLIAGYMLQICSQIDVLMSKLRNIATTSELQFTAIKSSVNHYILILRYS